MLDKIEKGIIDVKSEPPGIKVGNLPNSKTEAVSLESQTNKPV